MNKTTHILLCKIVKKATVPGGRLILLLMPLFFAFACQKKLTQEEYAAFITDPDNGLRKTQVIENYELSVLYETPDYIVSREFKTNDLDAIEKRKAELDEYSHFQFRMKLTEGGNILTHDVTFENQESSRINHFSFDAAGDFQLVSAMDTMPCMIVVYSRNYNLTPTIDLSLTFGKIISNVDFQLIYTDNQFDLGKVKFLFKQEDLENIPELKF